MIDGQHRYKAYKLIEYVESLGSVPATVFSGTLDQAIGQALKGNSKDKLAMSKSEKTNAAWRLVISTSLSLNQLVEVSTISKPTIALMREVMRRLRESEPDKVLDRLTWREALRKFQGREEEEFATDPEWRNKRTAAVAQTLSNTFGGEFKRKPEAFWESCKEVRQHPHRSLFRMYAIDLEDYHVEDLEMPMRNDF